MDKIELPSSVPLSNALLFNDDIPPVVLRTFARLYALAWKHHYDRTDRLTTDDLLALLGLGRRQMYDHIGKLHEMGVLDWASDGRYGYIFTFPKNYNVSLPEEETSQPRAGLVDAWVTAPPAEQQFELPAASELSPEPMSAEIRTWGNMPAVEIGSPTAKDDSPTAKNDSPTAKDGSPTAKDGSPTAKDGSPTAKNDSPAASGLRPEPIGAEIRTWGNVPAAENRTPGAEIRTWDNEPAAGNDSPAAENRTPGAEIRTWDNEPAAGNDSPSAENRTPGAENRTQPKPTAKNDSPGAEIRTPTAENRTPTAENRTPGAEIRTWPASVVVVVDNTSDLDPDKQQQQHGQRLGTPSAENRTPGAEIRTWPELEAALAQAGMWNDLAAGLTANLDVDGVLDALGWIAAVRADRRVRNHGAVLVKQLQAGRQAPQDWRPLAVCAVCGVVEDQCACGAHERVVPAVYYTAAIEPLEDGGRDRWGVCLTCGRVDCTGHDVAEEPAVEEQVAPIMASNGASGKGNGLESRIRGAWQGVAEYIQGRYGTTINLAEIDNYAVKVTFAGDERRTIVKVTQSVLNRDLKDYVEVIDAGPA